MTLTLKSYSRAKRSVKALLVPSHKHPSWGQWSLQRALRLHWKAEPAKLPSKANQALKKRISTLSLACFPAE